MDEQNQKEIIPNQTSPFFDPKDIEENKGVAALSYLFILFLIPLLTRKNSKFSQAHAKQGLILCIMEIIASFFIWIPILGWLLEILILVNIEWKILVHSPYWFLRRKN